MPRLLRILTGLLAALLVRPVVAQATPDPFPGPISTVELIRLLDTHVQPTADQWEKIELLHDDYREGFRVLREGDMRRFLSADLRQLQEGGIPSRARLESVLKRLESIERKVKDLDDRLFDAISALLDDRQRADVPRAREARERHRLDTTLDAEGRHGGDVSDIALSSGFDAEQLRVIDPLLRTYEQQRTAGLRALAERSRRMMVEMVETIEKTGFAGVGLEELPADPAKAERLMQAVQQAFEEANRRVEERARALRNLGRDAYVAIRSRVTGPAAHAFRSRFLASYYPEIDSDVSGIERILRSAIASRKTDASTREALLLIYEEFIRGDDPAVREAMELVDRLADSGPAMQFDQVAFEGFGTLSMDIRQRRLKAAEPLLDRIRELLDEDRIQQFESAPTAGSPLRRGFDPEATHEEETLTFADRPAGPTVPEPIDDSEVAALANGLGLEAGPRAVLAQLHEDYLARWQAEIRPMANDLRERAEQLDAEDDSAGDRGATRIGEAKRRVRERAEALDDAFLADATAGLGDGARPAVELERLARRLSLYGGTSLDYLGFASSVESPVNIARLVGFDGSLDEQAAGPARTALLARAEELGQAFRATFLRGLDIERQTIEIRAEYRRALRDAPEDAIPSDAASKVLDRQLQELEAESELIRRSRATALRKVFDEMVQAVPEESRDLLQKAFDRAAYPSIYRDRRSALPYLERAEALPDLDAEQRERLLALKSAYSREYFDACRRMAASSPSPRDLDEAFREFRNGPDEWRFARDEQSVRAVRRLQRILREEQAARIPGLMGYVDRLLDDVNPPPAATPRPAE